jgi:hypothetical protein
MKDAISDQVDERRRRHHHVHRVDEHDGTGPGMVPPCNQDKAACNPYNKPELLGRKAADLPHPQPPCNAEACPGVFKNMGPGVPRNRDYHTTLPNTENTVIGGAGVGGGAGMMLQVLTVPVISLVSLPFNPVKWLQDTDYQLIPWLRFNQLTIITAKLFGTNYSMSLN